MSTVNDILSWMDKTGLIITGINQQRNKIVDYFPVKILGNETSPSDTIRNVCVVLTVMTTFIITCISQVNMSSNVKEAYFWYNFGKWF